MTAQSPVYWLMFDDSGTATGRGGLSLHGELPAGAVPATKEQCQRPQAWRLHNGVIVPAQGTIAP